jgi:hypothetical protein
MRHVGKIRADGPDDRIGVGVRMGMHRIEYRDAGTGHP